MWQVSFRKFEETIYLISCDFILINFHIPNCLNAYKCKYYLGTKRWLQKCESLLIGMGWNDILLNNSFYKCTAQAECHYGTIYNLELSVKMILCPDMALSRLRTAVRTRGKQNYWWCSRAKVLNRQYFLQKFMRIWWLIDGNVQQNYAIQAVITMKMLFNQ